MDSDAYRFGQFVSEAILLLTAFVLIVWGFQQRQVYEKRQEGTVKLTIGASLMAAFGLVIAVSMFVGPQADTDDEATPDLGDEQVANLLYDADKYLRSIDQVHVKLTNDDSLSIDVTYVEDEEAVGSVFYGDAKIRVIRIGDDMFFNPSDEFWRNKGTPEVIDYIDRRWIRADMNDKRWAKYTAMPDRSVLLDLLTNPQTYTLDEPATIRGVACQVLKSSRDGSLVYISDSPRRMLRVEADNGSALDFDYDAPDVTLKAPSRIVEASTVLASASAS